MLICFSCFFLLRNQVILVEEEVDNETGPNVISERTWNTFETLFHRAGLHLLLVTEQSICSARYGYRRARTQWFNYSEVQWPLKQKFVFLGSLMVTTCY